MSVVEQEKQDSVSAERASMNSCVGEKCSLLPQGKEEDEQHTHRKEDQSIRWKVGSSPKQVWRERSVASITES